MRDRARKKDLPKICLVSSIPVTLWSFYSRLIRDLHDHGYAVTVISSNEPELQMLQNELCCSAIPARIQRRITPARDVLTLLRLIRLFARGGYDIVHAHTPKGGLIGMISAWLARIPNRIYTIHGLPLETATGLKRKLLWLAEWASCKLATKLLAVSPSLMKRVLDERLCPVKKINVLNKGSACGIDLRRFRLTKEVLQKAKKVRAEYDIPKEAIVIGFVGRITPDKGIKILTDSFVHLQQQHKNVRLLLAGRFDKVRETLDSETAKTIEYNKKIHWVGYVKNPVSFYAAMDMFVLPSRREGFPISPLEAAAMKLPTIASNVTGCTDAVVDGVTGLLVEVDDTEQLYQAMLKLVKEPKLRKRLGRQGRQRVVNYFPSDILIREHVKLYNKLIKRTNTS